MTTQWLVASAALIFVLRVLDMSCDTLRILATVRGRRWIAAAFGFAEAIIFIFALSEVLKPPVHWLQMIAYAAGFAGGSLIGTSLARHFASEFLLMRIISRTGAASVRDRLRAEGFAVTSVHGEGRDGPVDILFTLLRRKRGRLALDIVEALDPQAFVVCESIEYAVGGFIPRLAVPGVAIRR